MVMKYDPPIVGIELKKNGKVWVEVVFENGVVWRPRLWEVGAIISGIGKAEDIKYPAGKGHELTKDFFNACWGKTREQIYEMSLSKQYDPNGVMQSRYRSHQCPLCKTWHDGEQDECDDCVGASLAFDSVGS